MNNLTLLLKSQLFDSRYYAEHTGKTFEDRKAAAKHYLTWGWISGYSPSRKFDSEWFTQEYPEVAASEICPLLYYLKYAGSKRMYTSASEKTHTSVIMASQLFDEAYYGAQVKVTFTDRISAVSHYLASSNSTPPSHYFDPGYYLEAHEDVARSNVNPLLHYEVQGAREGRLPYERPRISLLVEAEKLFRQGCIKDAKSRLTELTEGTKDNTSARDAIQLLKAEIALLCGEHATTLSLCKAMLDKGWKAMHPFDYNRACGFLVQALCEQGLHQKARDIVIWAYQHLDTWHAAALSRLRQTLTCQGDLALFAGVVKPEIEKNDEFTTHALLEYSFAARDNGSMDLALELIKQRYIRGVTELHAFGSQPPGKTQNWQAEARLALSHLKECLDKENIPFFLISGTLLGCVRDHDIIEHDNDIDIGIMDDISIHKIRQALAGKGCFSVLPDVHEKLLRVRHANSVMADVFIHWHQDGMIHHLGRKTGWWNTPFSLEITTFLGEEYLLPSEKYEYLEENYGNWAVPETNFDTFADTPNMYVSDKQELAWYFYKTLLDKFIAGDAEGYHRVWLALCTVEDPTPEICAIYKMSSLTT